MEECSKLQEAAVRKALDQVYARIPEIQLAVLSTTDGFHVAAIGSKQDEPDLPEKFAVMASSLSALSEAAGKELGARHLDVAMLDFSGLQVLLRSVQARQKKFVLAVAADKTAVLGNLLWAVRECAHSIEEALNTEQ